MFRTKACLVVEVAVIRTAATEILLPVASHEFEILVNLRVATGSGADISRPAISAIGSGAICVALFSRAAVSFVARQSLCYAFLELALWAAVALCSFLVAQLLEDKG